MKIMTINQCLFLTAMTCLFGFSAPSDADTSNWIKKEISMIRSNTKNIDSSVLRVSLTAYKHATDKGYAKKDILTVIDYSKPSTSRRLWVFDLKDGKTLFNTYVTHGKNSGHLNSHDFSNREGSLKSSIGVFVTDRAYLGTHGLALKLKGLEHGINDNAYRRHIVMHGASYATPDIIKQYGRLGRSWGCTAVSPRLAKPLINTIKDDTVMVAYYPDRAWLHESAFLKR